MTSVRIATAKLWQCLREVLGEAAYDNYVAVHPVLAFPDPAVHLGERWLICRWAAANAEQGVNNTAHAGIHHRPRGTSRGWQKLFTPHGPDRTRERLPHGR